MPAGVASTGVGRASSLTGHHAAVHIAGGPSGHPPFNYLDRKGLPAGFALAFSEMLISGNMAWKMYSGLTESAALTIASGSFFLGQQKIMPALMRGSPWLFVPVIAPLLLMVFWLIRVRLTPGFKSPRLSRGKIVPQCSQ